jgi:hypothetical protein
MHVESSDDEAVYGNVCTFTLNKRSGNYYVAFDDFSKEVDDRGNIHGASQISKFNEFEWSYITSKVTEEIKSLIEAVNKSSRYEDKDRFSMKIFELLAASDLQGGRKTRNSRGGRRTRNRKRRGSRSSRYRRS